MGYDSDDDNCFNDYNSDYDERDDDDECDDADPRGIHAQLANL